MVIEQTKQSERGEQEQVSLRGIGAEELMPSRKYREEPSQWYSKPDCIVVVIVVATVVVIVVAAAVVVVI